MAFQTHPIGAMSEALVHHGVCLDNERADKVIAAGLLLREGYSARDIDTHIDAAIVSARTFVRRYLVPA